MERIDESVDRVLADYMQRRDAGEPLEPEDVIDDHPEIADELRSYFDMADLIDVVVERPETLLSVDVSTTVTAERPPLPSLRGYEIRGELGRGGMGIVYRALRHSTLNEVALKVLPPLVAADPHRLARFRREAVAAARLTASHVLQIHDVVEIDGMPIIVMPLIDGPNLGQIIRQRRGAPGNGSGTEWARLTEQEYIQAILRVADQVVEAVSAIHKAGILHRDIKPSNVLVDREGRAWLTDFGLSRLAEDQGITITGDRIGTQGYMSPEQSAGSSDIDFRADVFSLGVLLYEAFTGTLPYGRGNITEESPLAPSLRRRQKLLSQDCASVIEKAIDPVRSGRYLTSQDFAEDWSRVRQGLSPKARPMSAIARTGRWARRHVWVATTVALCAVVFLLLWNLIPPAPIEYEVRLPTKPGGAIGSLVPIDGDDGTLRSEGCIRSAQHVNGDLVFRNVPPGNYWVEVEVPGHGFHEAMRRVPDLSRGELPTTYRHQFWQAVGNVILLHEIAIPGEEITKNMVHEAAAPRFEIGMKEPFLHALAPHKVDIDEFFVDPGEATVGECYAVTASHLMPINALPPVIGLPMTGITFDQAIEYAERLGKRLPTEYEYELIATQRGKSRFPWGEDASVVTAETFGVGMRSALDLTQDTPPIRGLYSGVVEWTSSWATPYPPSSPEVHAVFRIVPEFRELRTIRGGPMWAAKIEGLTGGTPSAVPDANVTLDPRFRGSIFRSQAFPSLGFRCARSARPRFLQPIKPSD